MIKRNTSNAEIESDGFEGIDAGIDKKNLGFLFDIVSKQMYRKPIPSIVREITSNCFDSHIEAGVNDPVIIKVNEDEAGIYVIFKDVGVGMSPERMKKVYSKYFSSTKRESNDQIGMFGLGSKSPLSYTDSFYLTTWFDQVQYDYLIHTGKQTPRIELLLETASTERNGTEVKIYMKQDNDIYKFLSAFSSELLYFDNVYFDIYWRYSGLESLTNNYTIYDYENFKYRPDHSYSRECHLLIGKVAYPVNWEEIKMERLDIPVAVKFNIGDLEVTPERESIRYIDIEVEEGKFVSTQELIKERILKTIEELNSLYNEKIVTEFEDYQDYKNYKKVNKTLLALVDGYTLDISQIHKKPEAIFTPLRGFKGELPDNLFFNFYMTFQVEPHKKIKEIQLKAQFDSGTFNNLLLVPPASGKYNAVKNAYLHDYAKELTGSSTYFFFTERPVASKERTEWSISIKAFLRYLKLETLSFDLSETNLMKQYKMFQDYVRGEVSRLTFRYDDIIIPEQWLAARKAEKTKDRPEDSFIAYNYNETVSDNQVNLTRAKLETFTGFVIYGFTKDEELLRQFKILLSSGKYSKTTYNSKFIDSKKCLLIRIAQRTEKHLIGLKNTIYIYDFMGDNKIFKRIATAAMINKESKSLNLVGYAGHRNCHNFQDFMGDAFPPVADALREVRRACKDYADSVRTGENTEEFVNQLISLAKEYNLYDTDLLKTYQKLERYVAELDLINYIALTDDSIPYVVDYLVTKSKKVADLWVSPEPYEVALIQESIEKALYYLTLIQAYKDRGTRSRERPLSISTSTEVDQFYYKLREQLILYFSLIRYYSFKNLNLYGKETSIKNSIEIYENKFAA